jgi:hypothetical protein
MKTAVLIAISLSASATAQPAEAPLAHVRFERGSAQAPRVDLGHVVAWAMRNPESVVVIAGHADRENGTPRDVQLSLARAQAVRARLVGDGVNPDQIVINTYRAAGAPAHVVIWGTPTLR